MKIKLLYTLLFLIGHITFSQAQNGLAFDGTDDYIQTSYTGITGNMNRTIEAWIKTSTNTSQEIIVEMGTMPLGTRFTLNVRNSFLRIEIGGGGIDSSIPVDDNQWHHVAVTYENGAANEFQLYIDGVPDNKGNITATTVNTAAGTGLAIGRRNDGVNFFGGLIDEVRVWNTVRTAADIQNNMNNELCDVTGLVAYYKFNQGTAGGTNTSITSTPDDSGNGNTGTLNGFAMTGSTSNFVTGVALNATGIVQQTLNVSTCKQYTSPSGNYTWSSSNTYLDTILSANGCDSIFTINLTVNDTSSSISSATACKTYTAPDGQVYTSSQTIMATITNAAGCDSIMTINLTVLDPSSSITATACDSYTAPSGAVFTSSQVVTDVIPSSIPNCDSTITIDLTIVTVDSTVTVEGDSLIANEENATYQWVDCDNGNAPISGATGQVFVPATSGNYAVQVTVNGCTKTSKCFPVIPSSLSSLALKNIQIFPNPTQGNIVVDLNKTYQEITIGVLAINGKVLDTQSFSHTDLVHFDINNPAGFYILKIEADGGIYYHKVLKK